jgi:hypothetical protein
LPDTTERRREGRSPRDSTILVGARDRVGHFGKIRSSTISDGNSWDGSVKEDVVNIQSG